MKRNAADGLFTKSSSLFLTHKLHLGIDATKKILIPFPEKRWSSEEMSSIGPSDRIDTNQKKSGSNAAIQGSIRRKVIRSSGRVR
jgi:hypothetical protein